MTDRDSDAAAIMGDVSPFKMLFREIASPYQRLRRRTQHQLELLNRQSQMVAKAASRAEPRYRAKNALSSAAIGWLITRSGISQMISRGGLSRNVAPAK